MTITLGPRYEKWPSFLQKRAFGPELPWILDAFVPENCSVNLSPNFEDGLSEGSDPEQHQVLELITLETVLKVGPTSLRVTV